MAINQPFSAAGAKDIAELRRATQSAFGSLARQINVSLPAPSRGTSFPPRPVLGQEFYLEAAITGPPAFAVGWYKYADSWTAI